MLVIDGSYGEGGGQILRTALPLSIITNIPVKIYNIRARRPEPGLKRQHLVVVRLLKKLADAEVEGAYLGSTELVFRPRRLVYKELELDVGSAGSLPLIIQALAPLVTVLERPVTVKLTGGTDVPHSPSFDYMRYIFCKAVGVLGARLELLLEKRGFYPRGGGKVTVKLYPSTLQPAEFLGKEQPKKFWLWAAASEELKKRNVLGRIASSAKKLLGEVNSQLEYCKTLSVGVVATLGCWTEGRVLGADMLGEKGLPSEELGRQLAEKLLKEIQSGASVDKHLADMLVPFGFLAGRLVFRTSELTQHLLTNIWVCRQFIKREVRIDETTKKVEIL
ncbi:MAG: RNA 3'-terminal phosphate cyclase [bacterium]|nr:RNA 3'-terminal phosphate cyclase [bacterium]